MLLNNRRTKKFIKQCNNIVTLSRIACRVNAESEVSRNKAVSNKKVSVHRNFGNNIQHIVRFYFSIMYLRSVRLLKAGVEQAPLVVNN